MGMISPYKPWFPARLEQWGRDSFYQRVYGGVPEIGLHTPSHHPLFHRMFHEIKHPAMGVSHLWKPPYKMLPPKWCLLVYKPHFCIDKSTLNHSEMEVISQLSVHELGHHFVWKWCLPRPSCSERVRKTAKHGPRAPRSGPSGESEISSILPSGYVIAMEDHIVQRKNPLVRLGHFL